LCNKPKTTILKFDTLLAQFLYQHKKLALPGIGTFLLDSSFVAMDEPSKTKIPIEGISFSTKAPALPDEALIDFIRTYTGKMKPLAQADLDSYLTLAQQFINIGKPLFLEGIGTVQRIKNNYEFIPGAPNSIRLESAADRQMGSKRKSPMEEEEPIQRSNGLSRKLLLLLGIVGTLALIGWGGYYLYTQNGNGSTPSNSENVVTPIPLQDTLTNQATPTIDTLSGRNPLPDTTLNKPIQPAVTPVLPTAGTYKFVIETSSDKLRAISRYEQLKKNGALINLETKDSLTFKLFFVLPATAADTTRIKDSLNNYFNYDYNTKRLKRLTTIEN
jgi:hypothetical protein